MILVSIGAGGGGYRTPNRYYYDYSINNQNISININSLLLYRSNQVASDYLLWSLPFHIASSLSTGTCDTLYRYAHPFMASTCRKPITTFSFLFFFSLRFTYSRWASTLPSCLWSQRIFPSLRVHALLYTIFYRDASSVLLQLVKPMVKFYLLAYSRYPLRTLE